MNKALRIAVADDEPDVRDYFNRILPLLGHTVVAVASDGRELVEQCLEQKPDLIIADVRMPDMDGDTAIQQICLQRSTPYILVSAYSKSSLTPEKFDAEKGAYLTKPVKRADLEEAIHRLFADPQNGD